MEFGFLRFCRGPVGAEGTCLCLEPVEVVEDEEVEDVEVEVEVEEVDVEDVEVEDVEVDVSMGRTLSSSSESGSILSPRAQGDVCLLSSVYCVSLCRRNDHGAIPSRAAKTARRARTATIPQ